MSLVDQHEMSKVGLLDMEPIRDMMYLRNTLLGNRKHLQIKQDILRFQKLIYEVKK